MLCSIDVYWTLKSGGPVGLYINTCSNLDLIDCVQPADGIDQEFLLPSSMHEKGMSLLSLPAYKIRLHLSKNSQLMLVDVTGCM